MSGATMARTSTSPEDEMLRLARELLHDLRQGGVRLRDAAGGYTESAHKVAPSGPDDEEQGGDA